MVTKTYIKQCEKAEEVQKAWIPGIGDYCINRVDNEEVMIIASRGKIINKEYKFVYIGVGSRVQRANWLKKDKLILLPTQEQLQEMMRSWCKQEYKLHLTGLSNRDSINLYMVENVAKFADDYWQYLPNINILWLAFVMYMIYHKIWNGDNWQIKEKING